VALKPIGPSVQRVSLGALRVWRDDIAEMVDLVAQVTPNQQVTLRTDKYVLDAVDDLDNAEESTLAQLVVTGDGARVRLTLGPRASVLEVRDPDLRLRGFIQEVQRVAHRCSRRRASIAALAVVLVLGAGALRGGTAVGLLPQSPPLWVLALIVLPLGFATGLITGRAQSRTVLYTRTRAEAPTFWTRKRDDLLINVVALLVGGVIGYFVNMITTRE
jgi:hypothetical protein